MNPAVDNYLEVGCGRCPKGGTPDCKVHRWTQELLLIRDLILSCGLTEELKWGTPCYTFNGSNVLMISAFMDYCCISFFKGALLKDEKRLLVSPGPNSQAARLFKFTNIEGITSIKTDILSYVAEAVEIEKAGRKIVFRKEPEPRPEELLEIFASDPLLESAFDALTPGRQRGYILHFSAPKKSETRIRRIEKWIPMILNGYGIHDEYRMSQ